MKRSQAGKQEAQGSTLEELQKRRTEPTLKWERGTVLGPERGLGAGLDPRAKVDVPVEPPADMDKEEGMRSEYLWDLTALPFPVILVTTSDLAGNVNAAPKNWCAPGGARAFVFVCSTDHDTYRNLQTTGEFVVNVAGAELMPRLHALAARGKPDWANELDRAGLTALPSAKVKPPRIKECRVHLECRVRMLVELDSAHDLGSSEQGTDILVVGRIEAASADAEVLQAETYRERLRRIRPFVLAPIWNAAVVEDVEELENAWDMEY